MELFTVQMKLKAEWHDVTDNSALHPRLKASIDSFEAAFPNHEFRLHSVENDEVINHKKKEEEEPIDG